MITNLASGISLEVRQAACIIGCQFLLKIGATVALWSLGLSCQRSDVVRARLKPREARESNQEKVMMEGKGEEVSGEGGPEPSVAAEKKICRLSFFGWIYFIHFACPRSNVGINVGDSDISVEMLLLTR